MKKVLPIVIFVFICAFFFRPFFFQGKLPIPADTIVGLYHPFRDLYEKAYPRGVPFKNFLITDPVRQQYPWKWFSVKNEKKGSLPLWNPYAMGGAPLLGTMQSGAFYPLNVLLLIPPFSVGWSIFIFSQQLLAGIFLYLYLNNLKLKRIASVLGAIIYSFSGFFIAWLEWGTVIHTAVWLPLILLSIDKIFSSLRAIRQLAESAAISVNKRLLRRSEFIEWAPRNDILIWGGVFLFSLTSSFFAGHLQTFFYLLLVSILYFFARWWQSGRQKKILLLFLLFTFCFLLLTFIQWYPTLQLILQSGRDVDQVWQKDGWFIPWQHLIQFIAPDFFGNPTTLNYWGVWNYAELVGYVGIVPFIMALFALFFRRDKKTLFFGLLLFTSLLFALPTFLAKLPYQLQLPFFSTAQPTRLLFLVDFALAILAALGLDFYLRQNKKSQILFPIIFLGLLLCLLWVFVLGGYKSLFSVSIENILIAKRNLYFPTLILGISSILFVFHILSIRHSGKQRLFQNLFKKLHSNFSDSGQARMTWVLKGEVFVLLLIIITIFDLLRFSEKFIPFTDKAYLFPQTAALSFLQKDQSLYRIMATDSQIMAPNFSIMYQLQTVDGYDPLYLRRYGELIAAIERGKPDINPPFGFNRIITPHRTDSRLLDMLGVKYVLSLNEINILKYEKVFAEGQTKIYKNKNVFPRAYFVNTLKPVANKQEAINSLFDEKIDLKTTAIVEGWDANELNFASGEATIVSYSENGIKIETTSQLPAPRSLGEVGFLVLIDTFYPTWHAAIDGKETKIYRTNYNFRGIVVPAGKHTVVFTNSLL